MTDTREPAVHYARNLRRAPIVNPAPEGWPEPRWHVSASGDTGTSHVLVGRPYVVACQWCSDVFVAATKDEAVAMFREHEADMIRADHGSGAPRPGAPPRVTVRDEAQR